MISNITWVCGMPRSGTSWLSQIFNSHPDVRFKLSPLFSYRFKNAVGAEDSATRWEEFFTKVYETPDPFIDQTYRVEDGSYPRFEHKRSHPSHLVIKETRFHHLTEELLAKVPRLRLVYIVRHPAGAIHSWLTAPREFHSHADPLVEWRCGRHRKTAREESWGFDDWMAVSRQYLRLQRSSPARVHILVYEKLVSDPREEVRRLFDFCNLDWNPQTDEFLDQCHDEAHPSEYAVFKKPQVSDRWRTELDPRIACPILDELRNSELAGLFTE